MNRSRSVMGVWAALAGVAVCGAISLAKPPGAVQSDSIVGLSGALLRSGVSVPVQRIPAAPAVRAYTDAQWAQMEANQHPAMAALDAPDIVTATGGPTGCELNIECDDCNPCTDDSCDAITGTCVATLRADCTRCDDGLFCNGTDKCDNGTCVLHSGIKEFICMGGNNDGRACFVAGDPLGVCDQPADCQLVTPDPDPCRLFPSLICDELETTGVNLTGACVNFCNLDDPSSGAGGAEICDDGIACNGVETCVGLSTVGNGGFCVGNTTTRGQVCADAGDCSGAAPICGGVCREAADRLCGTPWSGYTAVCNEPNDCSQSFGRCCTPDGNDFVCSRSDQATCQTGGGLWLGVGDEVQTPLDDGADPPGSTTCLAEADSTSQLPGDSFLCPKYSAGIVGGDIVDVAGPAGVPTCVTYWEIGDDYRLSNCKGDPSNPNDPANSWYKVSTVRWIGGHLAGTGSRMRVTFYDLDGRFISDRVTTAAFPGGITRNTVILDERPVIPCAGFVTIKPAVQFSPSNRLEWAMTDSVQVGTTDSFYYIRKHGFCTGDAAISCNEDADCGADGPCTITSDALSGDKVVALEPVALPSGAAGLAIEIVGQKVPQPTGACCNSETGICEQKFPWVCDEEGGFFQGSGTKCNICANDDFRTCAAAGDCHVCDGGDREFEQCGCVGGVCTDGVCVGGTRDGLDCSCPGGQCDTSPLCLPSPPSCQVTACCDEVTGGCEVVTGNVCVDSMGVPTGQGACATDSECQPGFCRIASGACLGGDNPGDFCINDLECPGGTCEAPCPTGTLSQGFGSTCDPNCCTATAVSGADTCAEANIVLINVPTIGQPPVTVTMTSNNKAATFGDFVGDGSGTCEADIFDPAGGNRDRGWWHAFQIDGCADIRVDMCCTAEISGEIHQPQWDFIYADCAPCTAPVRVQATGPGSFPIEPIGSYTAPSGRGAPFCSSDDAWYTFRNLPAGTYYVPIFSGSGGHFGEYQLHITAVACVEAACCLPESVCLGGPMDGMGCAFNDDCAPSPGDEVCVGNWGQSEGLCCPGGVCDHDPVDRRCVGGTHDTLSCCLGGSDECRGNCVVDCRVLEKAECESLDGYWMGFGNLPLFDPPTLSCGGGVCQTGSCCIGPGVCQEDLDPDCVSPNCCADNDQFCINKKDCLGTNGTFVGGSRCAYIKPPCPACEIEDTNNCHNLDDVNFTAPSDVSMKPGGALKADDIVLESPQINEICVWGVYFDGLNGPNATHSCSGLVEDDFRVRFYADDGGGKPDHTALIAQAGGDPVVAALLGGVYVGPVAVVKTDTPSACPAGPPCPNLEVFTLTFPTMTLPTGLTIWLEVANNTDTPAGAEEPQSNTCYWWWAQSQNIFQQSTGTGNEWSYSGTDYRPAVHPQERSGLTGYLELGHDWTDMVFCLAGPNGPTNFTDPPAPTGSCCTCDGVFTDNQTLAQCTSRDSQHEKRWRRGLVGAEACLAFEFPGDDCGFFAAGSVASGLDCAAPPPVPGTAIQILEGGFEAYTVCANDSGQECFWVNNSCLGGDIWTNYVTTCTGELVMSMCHSGTFFGNYDSYMAVYHDFGDPTNCPCPGSFQDRLVQDSDEGCNGGGGGGAGVVQGLIVFPGECWTARLGGWGNNFFSAARGIARLDVGCIAAICFPSSPPELQTQFGPVANAGLPEPKQRVLSINAGDAGQQQAIRVTWDAQPNWPGGHDLLVGQKKWMTEPFQVCEGAGTGLENSPPNCGISPGQPQRWFWAARLDCDPLNAFYGDLTTLVNYCARTGESCQSDSDCGLGTCGVDGVIHLIDQGIVPSKNANQQAIYSVQVIELACSITVEDDFSLPLVVTQPVWGDIGVGADCPVLPPEGQAKLVTDVTNALAKFSNGLCAPKKTRVDVNGENLNFKADIIDVLQLLGAFGSGSTNYSFPAGPACAVGLDARDAARKVKPVRTSSRSAAAGG